MSKLVNDGINQDVFIPVAPKTCVMEAILITGYNLKYVYSYLKDKGCEEFPSSKQAYGQIWVFDNDTKECVAYTREVYEDTFTHNMREL